MANAQTANSGSDNSSRSLALLADLISFDTTSSKSNLDLIEFVEQYLASFSVSVELHFNTDRTKATLFATIGDGGAPGIILSGHSDVVPTTGQAWDSDPFKLLIKDGRAYGRGSCDMKGFLASVLAAVPAIAAANLPCPVYLAISYDEEVGCQGIAPLLNDLTARQLPVRACLVGEPSNMQPVSAHCGKQAFRCSFHGTALHSSLAPQGVNAIDYAVQALRRIAELGQTLMDCETSDQRFETPHPILNTGRIEGGKAVNIVADHCSFDLECRYPPGSLDQGIAEVLEQIVVRDLGAAMSARDSRAGAKINPLSAYPAFKADSQSTALALLTRLTGTNRFAAVNYGTEAGLFEQQGFPTVICGPGSIEQAHQPNEYLELSQLAACDDFLTRLIALLSQENQTSRTGSAA
ncbi:acetylornithine deacetylase [Rhodovibrionaceae bacterium A322]